MPNTPKHKPRVILVTGDSSGIGYASCEHLAARGRTVYGASRREPKGVAWTHLHMDVTDEASVAKVVASILDREGCIDAVVHSAGASFAGPFEETSIGEVRAHFEVNYFGAVRVLRAVLPPMRQQRRGRLLVIGSIGGLIGLQYLSHYSASKFALDGLIEAVRPEISPFGIDATVIHPGDFNTALSANRTTSGATQPGSPYYDVFHRAAEFYRKAEEQARSPGILACKIEALLDCPRLPVRVVVGTTFERLGVLAKNWLPSPLFEIIVGKAYGP
jgi:NAD(P)-dependent dehydrogenase (short-subunit alcohol dehydrogenase family)